jgi:hypothetical protein
MKIPHSRISDSDVFGFHRTIYFILELLFSLATIVLLVVGLVKACQGNPTDDFVVQQVLAAKIVSISALSFFLLYVIGILIEMIGGYDRITLFQFRLFYPVKIWKILLAIFAILFLIFGFIFPFIVLSVTNRHSVYQPESYSVWVDMGGSFDGIIVYLGCLLVYFAPLFAGAPKDEV